MYRLLVTTTIVVNSHTTNATCSVATETIEFETEKGANQAKQLIQANNNKGYHPTGVIQTAIALF